MNALQTLRPVEPHIGLPRVRRAFVLYGASDTGHADRRWSDCDHGARVAT